MTRGWEKRANEAALTSELTVFTFFLFLRRIRANDGSGKNLIGRREGSRGV
jgi:hypothetical protein